MKSVKINDCEYIYYDDEGDLKLCKKDNLYGAFDGDWNLVIPFENITPLRFRNGVCVTRREDYFGVVDAHGNVIIPFEYNTIHNYGHCSLIFVMKDKKMGVFNNRGEIVLPCEYDKIEKLDNVKSILYQCKRGDKVGLINDEGEVILKCEYEEIRGEKKSVEYELPTYTDELPTYTEWLILRKSKFCGAASVDGDIIVPCEYETISYDSIRDEFHMWRYGNSLRYKVKDRKLIGSAEYRKQLEDVIWLLDVWLIQPKNSFLLIDDKQPTLDKDLSYTETISALIDIQEFKKKTDGRIRVFDVLFNVLGVIMAALCLYASYKFVFLPFDDYAASISFHGFFVNVVLLVITVLIIILGIILSFLFYYLTVSFPRGVVAGMIYRRYDIYKNRIVSSRMEKYFLELAKWFYDWMYLSESGFEDAERCIDALAVKADKT